MMGELITSLLSLFHQDHSREPFSSLCLIQKAMVDGRHCVGPLRRFT
jgi:hypothetical protein